DVRVFNLGAVIRDCKIGSGAPPGKATIDTDHGRIVTVHEYFRQAAGPEVSKISVGDAELLGKIHAGIHVRGVVPVAHHTGAEFGYQSGIKDVAVIDTGALIERGAGGVEAVVRWATVDPQVRPIQSGVCHINVRKTVADEELIPRTQQVIDFDIERIDRFPLISGELNVIGQRGKRGR